MSDAINTAFQAAQAQFPEMTLEMAQAVIQAYETAHKPVYLTQDEKYTLAGKIRLENCSAKDVVQDVFDEVATMFVVRRR